MGVKVTTLNIRGKSFEIMVSESGSFYTDTADRRVQADSLDELRRRLMEITRKDSIKINVPFVDAVNVKEGVVVGIHQQTKNFMVRWDGATRTEQEKSYHDWIEPLTKEELDALKQLVKAKAYVTNELFRFVQSKRADIRKKVREAYDAEVQRLAEEQKKEERSKKASD